MNKTFLKACALFIAIVIVISAISCITASAAPSSYSKSSNSGKRNEVCVSLSGTSASSYYTGSYAFDTLSQNSASQILTSLRTLLKTTHTKTTSYDDCKNKADITDCENNSGKMVSLYTSYTTNYNASSINREHVWPKSLGGFDKSGPGADLHHIRPTEITPNSNRGNLKYGNVSGGKTSTGNASGKTAGQYGSYFEPLDNVKGDVARICLYMYVRYGGESSYTCGSITTVFQSVEVLLEWCELDPVDTWEMGRNEVVQNIQGNRNVFIDYPEYAWLLFGKEVPEDMATPSGKASGGNLGGNTGSGSTTPDTPVTPDPEPELPAGSASTGTLASPLTTTQAYNANKSLATGKASSSAYYVKGKVTSIGESGSYYKNVYISDGTTNLLIYTLNCSNGISSISVGDNIIVYGYFKNYNGTIEMATNGSTFVEVVKIVDETQTPDTPTTPDTPEASPTGTLESPLTATQAYNANKGLAQGVMSDDAYYVKGTVKSIGESGSYYKNVYITDGATDVLIYTLNLTSGIDSIAVGDEITVHGYFKNYNGTIEMATNNTNSTYVTVVKVGADEPVDDPTEDETDPIETETETDPVEIETDTDSVESDTVESDTFESDTVETDPVETDPVETDAVDSESESEEAVTETSAEASTNGSSNKTESGCGSSIAGGAVIISVACVLAVAFVRKKRD